MTIYAILEQLNVGGVVALVVVLLSLIEITPVKISPLKWIGSRVNGELTNEIKATNKRIDVIDGKLNAHIVESYRTQILDFADKVMDGQIFVHDKWRAMLKICAAYERMIEEEKLINGDATESIEYIKEKYQECAKAGMFSSVPLKKVSK